MFGTWERYPGSTDPWQQAAADRAKRADPLPRFLASIDRMIYIATAALAACFAAILLS